MAKQLFSCPKCGRKGTLGSEVPDGAKIRCPTCGHRFRLTEPALADLGVNLSQQVGSVGRS
jgi:DNA-directed RNA polymerase subunit RPC12/RpoP